MTDALGRPPASGEESPGPYAWAGTLGPLALRPAIVPDSDHRQRCPRAPRGGAGLRRAGCATGDSARLPAEAPT